MLAVTRSGYGFVQTEEGEFFVPRGMMGGAMDGDTVEVRIEPGGQAGRGSGQAHDGNRKSDAPVARVVRVLERAHEFIVGRYENAGPFGVVIPEDPRIAYDVFIPEAARNGAREGDVVLVRMDSYPTRKEPAVAHVEELLGQVGERGLGLELIIRRSRVETVFSDAALTEARSFVTGVDSDGELARESLRRDLRSTFVLTIDPTDARDFDDALSLEYREDGSLHLGVHIADVSHYVPWGSSVDIEARRRATSVYFPHSVLPMLPDELSSGLCSLRPEEDRLALTVDLTLRSDATVESAEFYPSLIRSALRLDYDTAARILDGGAEAAAEALALARTGTCDWCAGSGAAMGCEPITAEELARMLARFSAIARKRAKRRVKRGALDFDLPELRLVLDEELQVSGVTQRKTTPATSLVEEAMLAANEAVARYMTGLGLPMVYRIHERPDLARMRELQPVLEELGFELDFPLTELPAFPAVLAQAQERPDSSCVVPTMLRAMKRACYRDRLEEHYGLASAAYTHFTSPIRRYPDLLVHRLLKAQLGCVPAFALGASQRLVAVETSQAAALGASFAPSDMVSQLTWLCEHSSDMEQKAEVVTREVVDYLLCSYMDRFVGERYGARASGFTMSGIFVKLDNGAEGFISAASLPEPFEYDEIRSVYVGTESGRRIRLGTSLYVELVNVDMQRVRMDFRLLS